MQINADGMNTGTEIASLTHSFARGSQGEMPPEHPLQPGPIGTTHIHRGGFSVPIYQNGS